MDENISLICNRCGNIKEDCECEEEIELEDISDDILETGYDGDCF